MLKYLKTSKLSEMLAYHEERIIELTDGSEVSDSDSSDKPFSDKIIEEEKTPEIVTDLKFEDCVAPEVQNAVNFSVIQGTSVNNAKKNKLLGMMIQGKQKPPKVKKFMQDEVGDYGVAFGVPHISKINKKNKSLEQDEGALSSLSVLKEKLSPRKKRRSSIPK
mmetsp:Transcript_14057/g.21901  ORF Transcript_14057/g.21901 Transcript_14057/m.21901 type:complete len:163 (+) Transcript_14057:2513-3001(+)